MYIADRRLSEALERSRGSAVSVVTNKKALIKDTTTLGILGIDSNLNPGYGNDGWQNA